MKEAYTVAQLKQTIKVLQDLFDLVRVVEPVNTVAVDLGEREGDALSFKTYSCYAVWRNKSERCLNCISLRALQQRERQTKFEFINQEVYSVIAQPIEVDGQPMVLEMVNRIHDSVLLGAYGENDFVDMITKYTQRRRIDEQTGLFGEETFREKLYLRQQKPGDFSVILVDVDGLDRINQRFGCPVGDRVLRAIGQVLGLAFSTLRDSVVSRLGGDEFAILGDLDSEAMLSRLRECQERIKRLRFEGLEELRASVSMGCARYLELTEHSRGGIFALARERLAAAKRLGPGHLVDKDEADHE